MRKLQNLFALLLFAVTSQAKSGLIFISSTEVSPSLESLPSTYTKTPQMEVTEKKLIKKIKIILPNNYCKDPKLQILPDSKRLLTFNTEYFNTCWDYCKTTRYCKSFSFHNRTRNCTLFQQLHTVESISPNTSLVIGRRNCLECLGDVIDVVAKGQLGLRLEQVGFSRCLGVSNKKLYLNNRQGFKLSWKPCDKANIWKLSETTCLNGQFEQSCVRLSLIGLNWSVEWIIHENGNTSVYLAKKTNITQQVLALQKRLVDKACRFDFSTPNAVNEVEGAQGNVLFTDIDRSSQRRNKSLKGITISVPIVHHTCSLNQFVVNNGEVLNDDKVPHFLAGATVKVQCITGFGVKSLDFSDIQEVKCSKRIRLRHCSDMKDGQILFSHYTLLGFLIAGLLICWNTVRILCKC